MTPTSQGFLDANLEITSLFNELPASGAHARASSTFNSSGRGSRSGVPKRALVFACHWPPYSRALSHKVDAHGEFGYPSPFSHALELFSCITSSRAFLRPSSILSLLCPARLHAEPKVTFTRTSGNRFWRSTFGRLFEFRRYGPRATLFQFMKLTALNRDGLRRFSALL